MLCDWTAQPSHELSLICIKHSTSRLLAGQTTVPYFVESPNSSVTK